MSIKKKKHSRFARAVFPSKLIYAFQRRGSEHGARVRVRVGVGVGVRVRVKVRVRKKEEDMYCKVWMGEK